MLLPPIEKEGDIGPEGPFIACYSIVGGSSISGPLGRLYCCTCYRKSSIKRRLSLKELNLYFKIMNVKLCLLNQEIAVICGGD